MCLVGPAYAKTLWYERVGNSVRGTKQASVAAGRFRSGPGETQGRAGSNHRDSDSSPCAGSPWEDSKQQKDMTWLTFSRLTLAAGRGEGCMEARDGAGR